MTDNTITKSTELTQKGIDLIDRIYDKVFCIFTDTDLGYDSEEKNLYEGILISVEFAVRKNKLDWVATVKIGETTCIRVWSEDFENKVFFNKEIAQRIYGMEIKSYES